MKAVCGLDVHKDSIYLCILHSDGELFEQVFGVLTFQLEEMCTQIAPEAPCLGGNDGEYQHLLDTNMACAVSPLYPSSGQPLFHQTAPRSQE